MKLGRVAVAALALCAALAVPKAEAANGSNYLHLINGVDYYYLKAPTLGNSPGIWRCFPHEMLHSPTLVVDTNSPLVGTYATKINAVHLTVTGSAGFLLQYPTIALSSNAVHCNFFTSTGALNWGLASVTGSGAGTFVVGPVGNGASPVNLLALVTGLSILNPGTGAGNIVQLVLNLGPPLFTASTIAVPEGESLTLYVGDNPNMTGAGAMQYWTGSSDEQNLCSSYSFLWSAGNGFMYSFLPNFEWSVGLGSLDATLTAAITDGTTAGVDVGLNDAHSPVYGFVPGFDQGTGSQTISVSGTSGLGEVIGFAVYDEDNIYGGAGRLCLANIWGVDAAGLGTCNTRASNPTWFTFPTGGPGGPPLSGIWPQIPRSVGQIDTLATALLANGIWILSTNHTTAPGALNIPWWPATNGQISGSNMSGTNGGFPIPIPPLPTLFGLELFFWNWATDSTNSFLDHNGNKGHSLTNGYYSLFFP